MISAQEDLKVLYEFYKEGEAEDSDVKLAEKLRSEIINLSRDINVPSEAIGYLKGHVDIIKDISDYSELTEKEDDEFSGSDPRGGSTIKDYESADGNAGYFQHEFKIYGREKKPCKACDTKIERIIQGGRSTFYCSRCQKK